MFLISNQRSKKIRKERKYLSTILVRSKFRWYSAGFLSVGGMRWSYWYLRRWWSRWCKWSWLGWGMWLSPGDRAGMETWDLDWTMDGFLRGQAGPGSRCHISGASSWSRSRLGFLCSDSNRHRYVSLFHASQHREGITGPQSPAKRTFVALHFILKYT